MTWALLFLACPAPEPPKDPATTRPAPVPEPTPEPTTEPEPTSPGCDSDDDGTCPPEDCDDDDPATYPGATPICDNGADEDCSLRADCRWYTTDQAPVVMSEPTDRFAVNTLLGVGDLDGDGIDEIAVERQETGLTRLFLIQGPPTATSVLYPWATLTNGTYSFGTAVASVGDVTGDGLPDLAIGDPDGSEGINEGQVYVYGSPFSGPVPPTPVLTLDPRPAAYEYAASNGLLAAPLLASGTALVASDAGDGPGGTLWLVDPTLTGRVRVPDVALAITGQANDALRALAAGDLNQDGAVDLVIGGPGGDHPWNLELGRVYVVLGPITTSGSIMDLAVAIWEADASTRGLGASATIADLDGDGVPDLAVGAPYTDDDEVDPYDGEVRIAYAPLADGPRILTDLVLTGAPESQTGTRLAASDLDLDGSDDLLVVGAIGEGFVSVFYGPLPTNGPIVATDGDFGVRGLGAASYTGYHLDVGEFDGDGVPDLVFERRGLGWSDVPVFFGAELW